MRITANRRRPAFTLVEMMVSAALIIFMMYILSSAFVEGLTAFRTLKTQGDMQEKLRATATALRTDLSRPHFEAEGDQSLHGPHLSAQRLDLPGWTPPKKGYFRIYQGTDQPDSSLTTFNDGRDPDNPSLLHTRAVDHFLQFTVKLDGRKLNEFFASQVLSTIPGASAPLDTLNKFNTPDYNSRPDDRAGSLQDRSLFTSTWAEVTYYLRPYTTSVGTAVPNLSTNGSNASVPANAAYRRYALYRRQRLLVDFDDDKERYTAGFPLLPTASSLNGGFLDVSTWETGLGGNRRFFFNTPWNVNNPLRRFGVPQFVSGGANVAGIPLPMVDRLRSPQERFGDVYNVALPEAAGDLLLADVLNFEIKALWEVPVTGGTSPFRFAVRTPQANNPDYPFDLLPHGSMSGPRPEPTNPLSHPRLANHRVFDTWSRQNSPTGVTPAYNYGDTLPPGPDTGGTPATANWNKGHFNPPTAAIPESIPLRVRIRALQIEIRIWDVKSRQTRQITVIQDV